MTLTEYREKYKLTRAELAEKLKLHPSIVYRVEEGRVGKSVIRRIVEGTNGEVTANDLLGIRVVVDAGKPAA